MLSNIPETSLSLSHKNIEKPENADTLEEDENLQDVRRFNSQGAMFLLTI